MTECDASPVNPVKPFVPDDYSPETCSEIYTEHYNADLLYIITAL